MDSISYSMLGCFSERGSLSMNDIAMFGKTDVMDIQPFVKYLFDAKLIEFDPEHPHSDTLCVLTDKLRITPSGLAELEKTKKQKRKEKWTEIRSWIAIAVSIAAFIKSFVFPG